MTPDPGTSATPEADPAGGGWVPVRRAVLRDALGVGVAVGAYGIGFGALAVASGMSALQAQALSVLMFTGASQFALVGVLGAGGGVVAAVATAWLLGARNALYGLRLAPVLRVRGLQRAVAAHLTIDESTAMAIGRDEAAFDGRASRLAFWATGASVFVMWNLATLAGALGAAAMGDPRALGLDAAIPAGFLALLWPRLRDRSTWAVAAGGAVIALALTPVLRPGLPVLAASAAAVVGGVRAARGVAATAGARP